MNATGNVYKADHDCKQTYYHIRRLNDELCSKHQLSVISPTNQRGKSYKEWTSGRNGTSWKIKLKQDIDEAIQNADTYEQCMELIRALDNLNQYLDRTPGQE